MSTMTDSDFPELQQALDGRYEIEDFLGRGGMGLVYLARERRLERRVALKVLTPERAADRDSRERFLREARIAASLSHPNIVPIHVVETVGDIVFFAMTYVAGETLEARVRRVGPLAPLEGARLLSAIAEALDYAHARGVVHRDVKPDNILLEQGTGRVLLSDFGIAEVSPTGQTRGGSIVGHAAFMSPEQARGQPVNARSDLYSLGVVAFYALSGRLPFDAATDEELLAKQVAEPAPPLAEVVPGVPTRLAAIVDRCLAKDPAARFEHGFALVQAVAFALDALTAPPIAARAFLTRSRHLIWAARFYAGLWGAAALPVAVWAWLYEPAGRLAAAAGLVLSALFPAAILLARVRRLVATGHRHEDLLDALDADWARRREELAFLYGAESSPFVRALRWMAFASLAFAVALTSAFSSRPDLVWTTGVPTLWAGFGGTALLAALIARARTEQRTDPASARRVWFWHGWPGRALFWLAGTGRRGGRALNMATPGFETPA